MTLFSEFLKILCLCKDTSWCFHGDAIFIGETPFLSFIIASNGTKTTKIMREGGRRQPTPNFLHSFTPSSLGLFFQYFITAVECCSRNSLESVQRNGHHSLSARYDPVYPIGSTFSFFFTAIRDQTVRFLSLQSKIMAVRARRGSQLWWWLRLR